MKDIHDEIDERKRCLVDKVAEGKSKGKEIMECELTAVRRSRVVHEHLEKLDYEINAAFNEKMKKINGEKEKLAAKINMEADGEIAKIVEQINKRRYERLQENDEDSNGKIKSIKDKKGVLNRDLKHVEEKFRHESGLQSTNLQHLSKALDEALSKADKLVNEEKDLLTEFKTVMQSLDQGLEAEDNVENFRYESFFVEKIVFRREDGNTFGRLGVPRNEWEKEGEFYTGLLRRQDMFTIGSLKNGGFVFRDMNAGVIYAKNTSHETLKNVVASKNPYDIYSCTTLGDGRIVCGTLNAEIVIYDPTWKHIRTIVLTRERKGKTTWVTTGNNGMVVAAVYESDTLFIYNPDDGSFVRSVSFHGGPIYSIGCLSSGDIVVSTKCSEGQDVCVFDGSGVVKSTTHFHGKNVKSIAVDKRTDLIYIMNNVRSMGSVDIMAPNGEVTAEKIVTFTAYFPIQLYCSITDTSKLIVGMQSNIFLYRQTLTTVSELLA